MSKRGGVQAKNYVLHVPKDGLTFDLSLCGRKNVNFFGSMVEVERDTQSGGEQCCKVCRKKLSDLDKSLPNN